MIQEEKRKYIAELIKRFKKETGKEATDGGKVSEQFQRFGNECQVPLFK